MKNLLREKGVNQIENKMLKIIPNQNSMLIAHVVKPMSATTLIFVWHAPRESAADEQQSTTDQLQNEKMVLPSRPISCRSADQQERPSAVNNFSYLHVDQLPSNYTALYLMNNFEHHVLAANIFGIHDNSHIQREKTRNG